MYLSLDWLKDYVEIPKSVTPDDLGMKLTTHTVEIDGVEKQSDKFKNVVVGKIKEVNPHPNADRLRLAKVDVGTDVLDIVCGAPNIAVGQLVPVALVGAVLPNGMEIKEAEVRGEKSCGMMCAEDELGLGDDHSGIIILEKRAKIGQSFGDYLKLEDVIFEVDNKSITNRPDLWGHVGMAREISAFLGTKTKPKFNNLFSSEIKVDSKDIKIEVKVENQDLCPRYMAVAMDGIEIKDSPEWMRERLIAVGMRPINSIVDITNYVMLELGQPIHAFDQTKIDKIVVRTAKKNEEITTLDGKKRKLSSEDLVITDGKKPVAIAGVMGGENSEVENSTKSIVIEVANFNPVSTRKTSQRQDLRTEASARFEKSLDPNLCETTIARVVELVKELNPDARVVSSVVDQKKFKLDQGPIDLSLEWLNNIIGQKIEEKKVVDIFTKLGFEVKSKKENLQVTIPTWRATKDISIKEDLVEEVARTIGYDNINPKAPKVEMLAPLVNQERLFVRRVKNILSQGAKLTEVYNYSFVGEELLNKFEINYSDYIRLANPILTQHTMLRQNLATNLFGVVKNNQARQEDIKIFEIGNVFLSLDGENLKEGKGSEKLPYQEKRLGIILAKTKNNDLLRDLKGVLQYLSSYFGLDLEFKQSEATPSWANKNDATQVVVEGKMVGSILGISQAVKQKLGIKKEAMIAEISLREIYKLYSKKPYKVYQEYEKFPPAVRDLAFVVEAKVLYSDIYKEIVSFHEYIKQAELFDVYEGGKIGEDKKSLAFHLVYQAEKTMTSEEVDKIQAGLIERLENKFNAKIRNF